MQPGPEKRSIQLTGPLGSADLPSICANCAQPSAGYAVIESVFCRSDTEGPDLHLVGWMRAPFCRPCLDRHAAERPPVPFLDNALTIFRTAEVFAGIAPGLTGLFILYIGLPRLLRFDLLSVLFFGGLAAMFFVFAYWGFRAAWDKTERYRARPPSSVTSAISFTDDLREMFEPSRHIYTMRNPQFAEAFIELNRARHWCPDGRVARVAGQKRRLMYILIGIALAAVAVYSVLDDLGLLP